MIKYYRAYILMEKRQESSIYRKSATIYYWLYIKRSRERKKEENRLSIRKKAEEVARIPHRHRSDRDHRFHHQKCHHQYHQFRMQNYRR